MHPVILLFFVAGLQGGWCQDDEAKIKYPADLVDTISIRCPINETRSKCGCERTCQTFPNQNRACIKCSSCICIDGYMRDENTGRCVLVQDCPISANCPYDSVLVDPCITTTCVPYQFPQFPQVVTSAARSQFPMCSRVCVPKCECKKGFVMYNCKCYTLSPFLGHFDSITLPPPREFETIGPVYEVARSHGHKKHHKKHHKRHHAHKSHKQHN